MTPLYNQTLTRTQIMARTGSLAAFGGVRLMTLADGLERGVRMLDFRTGSGLRFSVLLDRGMDIAEVEHKGRAIGWQSPTGFRHPAFHEPEGEDGLGFTRSFSGFLATCGLDHILGPEEVPALNYNYPRRATTVCTGASPIFPRVSPAMASGGRATAASCGPRGPWCRPRFLAKCCTCTGGSRPIWGATPSA